MIGDLIVEPECQMDVVGYYRLAMDFDFEAT